MKYLTIKVVCQAYMYHQIMAYENIIAYDLLTFVITNMEVMIIYIADRKLWNAKSYFKIICRAVHATLCTIL